MNPLVEPSPVQKMRMKYGLSAEDISIELEISRPAIYKMEHGEIPLSEEFADYLEWMTGTDPIRLQNKWIHFYRSLPKYPEYYNQPVKTKRDSEYVSSFKYYIENICSNTNLPYDMFITNTFTSYARCGRLLKVNPSSITKPAEFPAQISSALTIAGFGNLVPALVRNF